MLTIIKIRPLISNSVIFLLWRFIFIKSSKVICSSVLFATPASPSFSKSSNDTWKILLILTILSKSGEVLSDSHLEIVCLDTLSFSANCSCVIPESFLNWLILFPISILCPPLRAILNKINNFFYQHCFTFALKIITFMKLLVFLHFKCSYKGI